MIDDTPFAVEDTAMKYVKVDSSQIAEIGYGDGVYGPHTLGLKFPPNKKQIAAGEAGSEYHYQNITPEMHEEFLNAESVYSYFGKNIKGRPDLYPFTKIETTPNPPQPPSSPNGGGTTSFESLNSIPTGTIETPASTALAIIDTTEDELLFTPGKITAAQLAAGRQWYLTEAKKYDIATEKQRAELKRFARPLQKLRTGIEARAKELTGATKRKIAAIDAEKRRLVAIVGGIEDEVLAPLTAWEREEETRTVRLSKIVEALALKAYSAYPTVPAIEQAIAELESFDLSTMQEYRVGAESAIAASLKVLKPELERRKIAEANEAELAKLRAEAAERAEKDRLAEAARLAREAAEREARESVARAERERLEAVERAERAEAEKVAAVEAERKRQEAEASRVKAEAEARAADEEHRRQVNYEAASALAQEVPVDDLTAHQIIEAIANGLIPHVTVNY